MFIMLDSFRKDLVRGTVSAVPFIVRKADRNILVNTAIYGRLTRFIFLLSEYYSMITF